MNILAWIIFGALVGSIASIVMKNNQSQGLLMDIVLGVIGSFVGGLIMSIFGRPGITGFDLYSFFVALLGAIVLIWLGRRFA